MKHAKKGGMPELRPANFVGGKKANGHKTTCKCPICVNMKHQKASKKNRRVKRSKRTRRGGGGGDSDEEDNALDISNEDYDNNPNPQDDDQDEDPAGNQVNGQLFGDDDNVMGPPDAAPVAAGVANAAQPADDAGMGGKKKRKSNGHKANCKCPICKNMKMKKGGALDDESSSDGDSSSNSDGDSSSDSESNGGGKKKRKGNGHKAACKCPICKNMKKGGVKSPYADKDPDNKQTDDRQATGALVEAEKGKSEFGKKEREKEREKEIEKEKTMSKNKPDLGGSRRRRKTRKSRKTRKIRKRR
jgi:hypothetical protein